MRILWATVALLAIAGCSAPIEDTTGTSTSTSTSPPTPPIVAYSGCQGFHTFFPSPAAAFAGLQPENFTIDADQAGMVRIPVFAFDCANQTVMEMWALLPVVPPANHANDTYAVDAVVLQAFTTNATHHAQYRAWGFAETLARLATGKSSEYNDGAAAHADTVGLSDAQVSYTLRTAVQAGPGAFDSATYRFWVANGTRAIGWVEAAATPSTTVGAGSATFQSSGDEGGAPPATAGIAHRVEGVGMTLAWHPLP